MKGSDLNKPALTAVPFDINSKVCPSGAALATSSPATMPPAPGRLSTMTGWPKRSDSFCATARTVRSATPPAPKGTTMRRGLLGKGVWASSPLAGHALRARDCNK